VRVCVCVCVCVYVCVCHYVVHFYPVLLSVCICDVTYSYVKCFVCDCYISLATLPRVLCVYTKESLFVLHH